MRQHEIPFFAPSIGEAEIEAVVETLRSGWLTTGPKVRQFEEAFGRRVGARHALATSSATAALHLALEAAGVGPGDEVLVPTLTFASTGEVVGADTAQALGALASMVAIIAGSQSQE
ncbi:MAG TPA: DegT/DnrJ/EryC1/StrS aminotransferase family protein, partial [Planctomycetaceae bacterium]|nr:DegT/DnrJ/EryC1/StrS aminotransferase family protein [Planctomycetaceae bacterium]